MNPIEQKAFRQLQECASKFNPENELSGWTVQTSKKGIYYLHEVSSLAFHTFGAAKIAVQAFSQMGPSAITKSVAEEDDEDDDRDEVLNICSCLDGVVGQLHKHVEMLESYMKKQPQKTAETSWTLKTKIVDMYDRCAYVHVDKNSMALSQKDTLLQRSTKLRCQLLMAACAVLPRCIDQATHQDTDNIACIHCCKSSDALVLTTQL